MTPPSDIRRFRNQDLVLRVSDTVDSAKWNESRYELFFEALCGTRDYQRTALRSTLRYLAGGHYTTLRQLAEENFHSNDVLLDRYGTFAQLERHLLLPDKLYCTLDLATGTGKSFVLYGLAMVCLAEGIADRVLVLCPSNTIEAGLVEKFRQLASDTSLMDALPADARLKVPRIIRADESVVDGCICVENFHAILPHVKSSVRDSLAGRGETTLVLNDEVHHVANGGQLERRKWLEFLDDAAFGFRRVVGVSGTCYVNDDYFADVINRYSLRQAIEDGVVKSVDYVAEEDLGNDENERFQIVLDNHRRHRVRYKHVKPLTIIVTKDIRACEQVAEDLVDFLAEAEGLPDEDARHKVLVVTSHARHAPNLALLSTVDSVDSPVEFVCSVSMLTEGWDVKNVFQIVPHEQRAFNSKLLISQVLGRGLRVPPEYKGERPAVTVFNHDSWSGSIRHLVEEVLEIEKRVASFPMPSRSAFDFEIHHLDYVRAPESRTYVQEGEYDLLKKGYVELPSQVATIHREVEYERATTGERHTRTTSVAVRMFPADDVATHVHLRLKSIDEESRSSEDRKLWTSYATRYDLNWCKQMVVQSLRQIGETDDKVSEENRQKILQSLGPLHRGEAKSVRYELRPERLQTISTSARPTSSVSLNVLRRGESAFFWSPESADSYADESLAIFTEATSDEDSDIPPKFRVAVPNAFLFKTSLNIVITDREPERKFVKKLVERDNATAIDAWLKSADRDFYPIEFSWRKGDHTRRATFNPDFFIKVGASIFVVEIKDDTEVNDPSDENRKKAEFAREHFQRVNEHQKETQYQVNFLSPADYDVFFQKLRAGELAGYRSHLDVALRG